MGPNTEDGSLDTSIKVAFATTDMQEVNQHFGAAESFAMYAVTPDKATLIEVTEFGRLDMDGNEDKLGGKIEALHGCAAVYSNAVGASAIGQLKSAGIQPVKVSAGAVIADLLESLREELIAGPSTWVARALERQKPKDPERFAEMEAEGWEE
ncbi:NifB/NifX family molybdenum-iron cluster-binding protein [Thiosocius teredinicola]|uniref:NifB/NifX family molybdenum-iron cluster-binding protein n=1 Tax=Thiosocius teredinicola TaxID=1973002 RepID=UPI002FE45434